MDRFIGMTVLRADAPRGGGSPWRRLTARRRWVVALTAIAALAAGSLAFWPAGRDNSRPGTTIVRNGEIWLQGEITHDGCDQSENQIPIGDAGCSITLNGYEVIVVNGNARLLGTPGTVTGLDFSTDQSGRHAAVYAQLIGPHTASILSAAKYYARIAG
jgi:hypothetical protein